MLANAHVYAHNNRTFPQAELDSKINACFLLNEYGHQYFYCIIIVLILSSDLKKDLVEARTKLLLLDANYEH